ncbi:MAG: NAD(+) synthase [Holophagaceae bacterium]|nr:NAD(+) synthase [Holophagaceae bacterium]
MRIALLQINVAFGKPELNSKAIEEAYLEGIRLGADLVVAPELAVLGCHPRVWQLSADLLHSVEEESHRLRTITGAVPLIFGTCISNDLSNLSNELWWCEHGRVRTRVFQSLGFDLDTHNGCRTTQYLPIEYSGQKIGLVIGEDQPSLFAHQVEAGATIIINVVASVCSVGSYVPSSIKPSWALPPKSQQRWDFLSEQSKRYNIPIVFINRVGADGSLLFDGESCLIQPSGKTQRLNVFDENVCIVDTEKDGSHWNYESSKEGQWLCKALTMGIKDNLLQQNIESVVIGLSGGIDSSVLTALVSQAISPEKVLGVAIPTRFTSRESILLAKLQAQRLGIQYIEIDAEPPFSGAVTSLQTVLPDRQFCITDENLQSRCRAMILLALTSEPIIHQRMGTNRCAVVNSGNKSEIATGYFTMYGDGIGAFGPLGDLLKARVYTVARELGDLIPLEIIQRQPTAELRPNQTDESSLIPYRQLDAILGTLIEANRPYDLIFYDLEEVLEGQDLIEARATLPRIQSLIKNSEFKRRQLPYVLNVTNRTTGANQFQL